MVPDVRESLRQVGQRFMVGFDGHTASPDVKHLIRDLGVGHVILFARNVAEPEQVAELVRDADLLPGVQRAADLMLAGEGANIAGLLRRWVGDGERFGKV